ncbi:hypothetical protein AB0O54_21115 [Pseudarthrobacter oxydans]|uniref:serine O-acetyltransferase n=1 Tax=Pseudarthrobacter oxydans TaxID=1671 RepID=UPI003435FD6F
MKLAVTNSSFSAALLYRLSHFTGCKYGEGLGRVLSRLNLVINGIDIDFRARIGPGVLLQHPVGVVIGGDCDLGANVTLMSGVVLGRRDVVNGPDIGAYPSLGDDVLVGAGTVVLGPVIVGHGVRIGAHSLVLANVESGATVVGRWTGR